MLTTMPGGRRSAARPAVLGGRRRVDHRPDFGDDVGGKAGQPCVFTDHGFVFGQVYAERLVVGDEALLPLDAGPELRQRLVGLAGNRAETFLVIAPDAGDVA